MSTTLERPTAPPEPASLGASRESRRAAAADAIGSREDVLMLATLALLVSACAPLARVYVGLDFLRPVLGAVLLSVGLAWGARRLGAGPVGSLLVTIAGWIAFVSAAFLSDTLAAGVLPTGRTAGAAVQLWVRGLELMRLRPAPAFAEAGLMFITVSGVWAVSHAVEGLVMRLAAPLKAIAMTLVLWVVPLAVAPPTDRAWPWAVPFLVCSAVLLLAFAGTDLRRWGAWVPGGRGRRGAESTLVPAGGVIALIAIVAGSVLSGVLPGFGEAPWYEVRGIGGTTLTTNPIVDIRTRLVAQNAGPVLRVIAERPVYLRTTSLDVYSDAEEWTNAGIRGAPVGDTFPLEVPLGPVERVRIDVEVRDLPKAVLVPAPYQALTVSGPLADEFQYDRSNSTVTLDSGVTLQRGDTYSMVAAIPAPTAEQLEAAGVIRGHPRYTQLPPNVPGDVRRLAADIVADAEASTPFEQALAIQNELRSWEYSVEPPQGHSGQAMSAFITNRIGYCEQYAGTMAVMLRSLNLPARVAVGYTPGDLIDRDSNAYSISNANAHAWVEVLFEGLGWVAFEPTPRADGNVLVPSAANITPSRTIAETDGGPNEEIPNAPLGGDSPERPLGGGAAASDFPVAGEGGGAGGAAARGLPRAALVLLVAAVLAFGGLLLASRSKGSLVHRSSRDRVLHARDGIEVLARGIGLVPARWETDAEYLSRVAHRHGFTAREAAAALAGHAARARYALDLPAESGPAAEGAAGVLHDAVLADRSAWQRARIQVRGRVSTGWARLRGAQLSSSLRRSAPPPR
jgi:transglutaminase-like putative cysteine protease